MTKLEKVEQIKTLMWHPKIDEEINQLLKKGWKLLYIGESWREKEGGDIIYTLGKESK